MSIESHGQDRVRVAVVAYFGAFLEVIHAQLARIGHAHHGDQTAREETLHYANVFEISLFNDLNKIFNWVHVFRKVSNLKLNITT